MTDYLTWCFLRRRHGFTSSKLHEGSTTLCAEVDGGSAHGHTKRRPPETFPRVRGYSSSRQICRLHRFNCPGDQTPICERARRGSYQLIAAKPCPWPYEQRLIYAIRKIDGGTVLDHTAIAPAPICHGVTTGCLESAAKHKLKRMILRRSCITRRDSLMLTRCRNPADGF